MLPVGEYLFEINNNYTRIEKSRQNIYIDVIRESFFLSLHNY